MKVGRNAPCPCGSGRKYKQCCLPREEAAARGEREDFAAERRAAEQASEWQVDVVPLAISFDDDPAARPCVVLVVAKGIVVHTEMLARPPSGELGDIAELLAREILDAARQLGRRPARIVTRRRELAGALGALLAEAGWETTVAVGPVGDLEEASLSLRSSTAGRPAAATAPCSPDTWAGWGLPQGWCAELFSAAAAYYRAAPWKHLWDADLLEITAPSGHTWAASVMGRGGEEFGLVLYAAAEDYENLVAETPAGPMGALQEHVLSLLFERRKGLPPPMRKEIARAGWEVAGPAAYPTLLTLNALAGGLSRADAGDLVASLEAGAAFALANGEALDDCVEGITYRHDTTGTVVTLPAAEKGPTFERFEAGGGPEGPGARPEAALDGAAERDYEAFRAAQMEAVERFEAALREQGLSAATVRRHGNNAALLVEFLTGYQGVPLEALHEYDLREFLYEWMPRKSAASLTEVRALPTSLRRLFRYLDDTKGIRLPWAKELLADRDRLEIRYETFPGGFWWDADVDVWRMPFWIDMQARLFTHDGGLGELHEWGSRMGIVEARLERELQRRWLLWRDELIGEGVQAAVDLQARLFARQRAWEASPHPGLDDKTPIEAILEERRQRKAREDAIGADREQDPDRF